jgi:hypothetical protein
MAMGGRQDLKSETSVGFVYFLPIKYEYFSD